MRKATTLRQMLLSEDLSFLMEAHSGVSAKIVQEAGFKAIWGSGLTMSASKGVRDSNEASWTQVLDQLEFMNDATDLPILMDGDTGYGNFNNVRRLVKKLCQREIAGVCIEDKLFPKTNSFIGEAQPLAGIEEFCGKIRAAKDSQLDTDFVVVARVEALIAGRGQKEAFDRASAYFEAGADAILIHSKKSTADEIMEFEKVWDKECPLIIVPSKYPQTPVDVYRNTKISAVIWANHLLRASITSMQSVAKDIFISESTRSVEDKIATISEVFQLVDNDELSAAEEVYLPVPKKREAIILAASQGVELGELTKNTPKCLVSVRGKPLLHRQIESLREANIHDIQVVTGFGREHIKLDSAKTVANDLFAQTGECYSLSLALPKLIGAHEVLVMYGDVAFRQYILDGLIEADGDVVLAIDTSGSRQRPINSTSDWAKFEDEPSAPFIDHYDIKLKEVSRGNVPEVFHGEWVGFLKFSPRGLKLLKDEMGILEEKNTLKSANLPEIINNLAKKIRVTVYPVADHWADVDAVKDLLDAQLV